MSIRATFSYFQGMEGDMYQFYRIPKLLFTSEYFKNLSCEAKVLYGFIIVIAYNYTMPPTCSALSRFPPFSPYHPASLSDNKGRHF